eukprot:Nk52_evm15s265 gene=Nk52_evmTU15s265
MSKKKNIYNTPADFSSDFQFDSDEEGGGSYDSGITSNLMGIQSGVLSSIRQAQQQEKAQKKPTLIKANTQPHLRSNALLKAASMLKGDKSASIEKRASQAKLKLNNLEMDEDDELENYYKSLKKKNSAIRNADESDLSGIGSSDFLKPAKIENEYIKIKPVVEDKEQVSMKFVEIGNEGDENESTEQEDYSTKAGDEDDGEQIGIGSAAMYYSLPEEPDELSGSLSLEELDNVKDLMGNTKFMSDLDDSDIIEEAEEVNEEDQSVSDNNGVFEFKKRTSDSEESESVASVEEVEEESEIKSVRSDSQQSESAVDTPDSETKSSIADQISESDDVEDVEEDAYSSDYTTVTETENTSSTRTSQQSKSKRKHRSKTHAGHGLYPGTISSCDVNQAILQSILQRPVDMFNTTPIASSIIGSDVLQGKLELYDCYDFGLEKVVEGLCTKLRKYKAQAESSTCSTYQYTTLEDTLKYIKKNRKPKLSFSEALKQVQENDRLNSLL